jgi:GNAT superfamily N-acetyltransferase
MFTIAGTTDNDMDAVRALFLQYAAALPFDLGFQDFVTELAGLPAPYGAPGGCLLLARDRSAAAIGMVALKPLAAGVAEVKRLYLVPEARRFGLGRVLLARVIAEARARGYDRVRLDSHRASMAAAIRLYRQFGFVEIPPYGPDLGGAIVFFEKELGARGCAC